MDGRDDRFFKNQEKIISGDGKTIGGNVRRLRESRRIGQTEMVAKLQLRQVPDAWKKWNLERMGFEHLTEFEDNGPVFGMRF